MTAHFAGIEKGFDTTFDQLLQDARAERYHDGRIFPELRVDCLISPFDLEQKAHNTSQSKAVGPDVVPPEIVKCMPKAIARVLAPLALKCSGLVCEPFRWAGGRYKESFKNSGIQSLGIVQSDSSLRYVWEGRARVSPCQDR